MAFPMKLVLVRHGQSEANLVHKGLVPAPENFYKKMDSTMRLSNHGVEQAKAAGEFLKAEGYDFDRHYTSPFIRTMETALNMDVSDSWRLDDLLHERNWGEYGQLSPEDRKAKHLEIHNHLKENSFWYWVPDGGENLASSVRIRAQLFIEKLARKQGHESVVAVSHGEFVSVMGFAIQKTTPEEWGAKDKDKSLTLHNAIVAEYRRDNPNDPTDVRDFYKWKRFTVPWDKSLSHYNGEWVEIQSSIKNGNDMRQLIEAHPKILDNH